MPTLVGVFRSICSIAVDDGIAFDPESTAGTPIRKDAGYGGVRIDLRATLDGARLALQIDIGFGDAVTPAAQPVTYPTLLPDVPAPTLRAYPKATVVAEKLHAVTVLGMTNTRMPSPWPMAPARMRAMSDESQVVVPASFIALYIEPGRIKPKASREEIAARYEFCEDLATMLVDHARTKLWELGVTEADVLVRTHAGLATDSSGVSLVEAEWVIRRLAELLEWTRSESARQ